MDHFGHFLLYLNFMRDDRSCVLRSKFDQRFDPIVDQVTSLKTTRYPMVKRKLKNAVAKITRVSSVPADKCSTVLHLKNATARIQKAIEKIKTEGSTNLQSTLQRVHLHAWSRHWK
jgi:hypothetical protein